MILRAGNKLIRKTVEIKRDLVFRLTGAIDGTYNAPGEIRVLVYHGVSPSDPLRFNTRFISCELFEEHLRLFSKHCSIISFDELKAGKISNGKLNVVLTFDDGYRNNFEYAFPLLKKYNAPALFFVTGNRGEQWLFNDIMDVFPFVGPESITLSGRKFTLKKKGGRPQYSNSEGKRPAEVFYDLNRAGREQVLDQVFGITPRERFGPFRLYLDLMNELELREIISTPGYSIGAHGSSHADLSLLSHSDLAHELQQVQSKLSALYGKPCSLLAFPYGKYDANVIKAGTDAGFMDFFGTEFRNGSETLVTPRLTVNPFVSAANEMYYINKGNHE